MTPTNSSPRGFVLLITLLMITVVVTVTLSIVELTLRQVDLAIDGRDSERAFQAASAGVECAQRIARVRSGDIQSGNNTLFDCFANVTPTIRTVISPPLSTSGSGVSQRYRLEINWDNRCTEIDLFAINNAFEITPASINNLQSVIVNYRTVNFVCPAGSVCHVVAAAGYSSTCANKLQPGVLKRELLLEF